MATQEGKKATAGSEMTETELKDLREVFDLMDADKGGTLSVEEVKQLMELLGMHSRIDEVESMIQEIDADGNGTIDFEEFVMVMNKSQELPYNRQDLIRAFKIFSMDDDNDTPAGTIAPDKLERVLMHYCKGEVGEDEMLQLLGSLETTDAGHFDYVTKATVFLNK